MDFLDLASERYSCRNLDGRQPSQKDLDAIVKAALLAPTAMNGQAFKIFVLSSDKARKAVAEATDYTFGASTFLVLGANQGVGPERSTDNLNFPLVDAGIVGAHMILEIQDLGLATTWVGAFDPIVLKSAFPQMKPYTLVALFPVGYAAEGAQPSQEHFISKSEDAVVEKL